MRLAFLVSLAFVLFLPMAHAAVAPAALNASVISTTDAFKNPSLLTLADFQQMLLEAGFWTVDSANTGSANLLGADQIYTNPGLTQTIFLKLGLQQFAQDTFTAVSEGLAYQGATPEGTPYVLFFDQIPRSRARAIVQSLRAPREALKVQSSKSQLALRLLIPRAFAESACEPASSLETQSRTALSDLDGILGFRSLATCAITAMQSAQATVTKPYETLKTMILHPAKFWSNVKEDWKKLKHFVLNARSELSKFFKDLGAIDREMAAQIACSVIGLVAASAAVAAVISAVTGGLGIGAALESTAAAALLIAKLNQLKEIFKTISRAKAFAGIRSVGRLTKQVISCATH